MSWSRRARVRRSSTTPSRPSSALRRFERELARSSAHDQRAARVPSRRSAATTSSRRSTRFCGSSRATTPIVGGSRSGRARSSAIGVAHGLGTTVTATSRRSVPPHGRGHRGRRRHQPGACRRQEAIEHDETWDRPRRRGETARCRPTQPPAVPVERPAAAAAHGSGRARRAARAAARRRPAAAAGTRPNHRACPAGRLARPRPTRRRSVRRRRATGRHAAARARPATRRSARCRRGHPTRSDEGRRCARLAHGRRGRVERRPSQTNPAVFERCQSTRSPSSVAARAERSRRNGSRASRE